MHANRSAGAAFSDTLGGKSGPPRPGACAYIGQAAAPTTIVSAAIVILFFIFLCPFCIGMVTPGLYTPPHALAAHTRIQYAAAQLSRYLRLL